MKPEYLAFMTEVNWLHMQGFHQTADALFAIHAQQLTSQPHAGHDLERNGKRDDV